MDKRLQMVRYLGITPISPSFYFLVYNNLLPSVSMGAQDAHTQLNSFIILSLFLSFYRCICTADGKSHSPLIPASTYAKDGFLYWLFCEQQDHVSS